MKYLIFITFSFFAMSFTANNLFQDENIKTETNTPEEYNEGYTDGYCEGFKEGIGQHNWSCPMYVPYIDNTKYLNGCVSFKCGYNAGYKHGMKDGRKMRQ